MAAKIAWATDLEGIYRHVKEVPNGKACQCICRDCGEPLIACHPNPNLKTSYFAHFSNSECTGESALHKAAKQILEHLAQQKLCITLPSYYAKICGEDILGNEVYSMYDEPKPTWKMQSADSEKKFGAVIIDSLAANSENEIIGIEIYVSNKKSDADRLKFEELSFYAMEIDLSDTPRDVDRPTLESILLEGANRRWLNSHGQRKAKEKAEKKLPLLITSKNQKIIIEFRKLQEKIIAESLRRSIRVANLKSPKIVLSDGTSLCIEKKIGVKNIRLIQQDATDFMFDYEADVLVNDSHDKKKKIKVLFISHGERLKYSLPYVLFRLKADWYSEELKLTPKLINATNWKEKLEIMVQAEAATQNQLAAQKDASQLAYLDFLAKSPDKLTLIQQRYNVVLSQNDVPTDGWGLPDKLWVPLFMEFCLYKFRGKTIQINQLVDDSILEYPLQLEMSRSAKIKRAIAIRRLFDYLRNLGIIPYTSEASFKHIGKKDLLNFLIPRNIADKENMVKLIGYG